MEHVQNVQQRWPIVMFVQMGVNVQLVQVHIIQVEVDVHCVQVKDAVHVIRQVEHVQPVQVDIISQVALVHPAPVR